VELTYGWLPQDLGHGHLDIWRSERLDPVSSAFLTRRRRSCARGHVESECYLSARRAPPAKNEAIASAFGAALFGVHGGKPAPARYPAGDHDAVPRRRPSRHQARNSASSWGESIA
jgi:hypothetical protein